MRSMKFSTLTLLNFAPLLISVLLWRGGAPLTWPAYVLVQGGLISLNSHSVTRRSAFVSLSANLALSTLLAHALDTYLYFTQVSSDGLTKSIGLLGMIAGGIIVVAVSGITLVLNWKKWT